MLEKQRFFNLITIGLLFLSAKPTFAQPITNPSTRPQRIITRVLFKPPPDNKKPDQTRGAGSRNDGQCRNDATLANITNAPSTQTSMKPLVPSSDFGLTLAERPSFWIYLPETSARQVVLSIREVREEGIIHYSQTFVPITGKSGIVSLQPSPDSPPLEVGKAYQWAVVLVCGERPSPNDPAIASWVSRVALSQPSNDGSNLAQAAWYGEQGIWYDALTALVQARRSQPNNQDLIDIWTDFLKSGGLETMAIEPLNL